MTLEKDFELTTTKNITLLNPTMKDMIYWSNHNVYAFINTLVIIKSK